MCLSMISVAAQWPHFLGVVLLKHKCFVASPKLVCMCEMSLWVIQKSVHRITWAQLRGWAPCLRNGFQNVCLVPVGLLVAALLHHSLTMWACCCFGRDRSQVTMSPLFVGMRSESFCAGIDETSLGMGWMHHQSYEGGSAPWWCSHGTCFFGSTNTTLLYCRELVSPSKNMCAVFLYLSWPWLWTFPNFGNVCNEPLLCEWHLFF